MCIQRKELCPFYTCTHVNEGKLFPAFSGTAEILYDELCELGKKTVRPLPLFARANTNTNKQQQTATNHEKSIQALSVHNHFGRFMLILNYGMGCVVYAERIVQMASFFKLFFIYTNTPYNYFSFLFTTL